MAANRSSSAGGGVGRYRSIGVRQGKRLLGARAAAVQRGEVDLSAFLGFSQRLRGRRRGLQFRSSVRGRGLCYRTLGRLGGRRGGRVRLPEPSPPPVQLLKSLSRFLSSRSTLPFHPSAPPPPPPSLDTSNLEVNTPGNAVLRDCGARACSYVAPDPAPRAPSAPFFSPLHRGASTHPRSCARAARASLRLPPPSSVRFVRYAATVEI